MTKCYDVIVVGGNVAGSSLSYNLARAGLKVAMLDLLPSDKIGSDSCGDGLDVHEFKRLGLKTPTGKFVYGDVIRGKIIAPDQKNSMSAQGQIKAVHRYHFVQYLKDRAVDKGVELLAPARAIKPILKKGHVVGLKYRMVNEKSKVNPNPINEVKSRILVDASGINAVVRKRLPRDWWMTEKIRTNDIAICYKESRKFDSPLKDKFIHGYFSSEIAPGGFYWLATRSNTMMNVGLGINLKYMPISPKQQLYHRIIPKHRFVEGSKIVWHGGGLVPRRWPLGCTVGNGVLAAGDAGSMVNPMSGGGIGPSVFAGKIGGKVITTAVEDGDFSKEKLWQYNYEYNSTYGPIQAGNFILRKTIENMTDKQLNGLLSVKLFSEKEIISVIENGKLELGFLSKLKKFSKLAKYPKLLLILRNLYKNMETARKLYQQFPENIDQFPHWKKKADIFFNKFS
jgi:flavin-dependent dehydrogenase